MIINFYLTPIFWKKFEMLFFFFYICFCTHSVIFNFKVRKSVHKQVSYSFKGVNDGFASKIIFSYFTSSFYSVRLFISRYIYISTYHSPSLLITPHEIFMFIFFTLRIFINIKKKLLFCCCLYMVPYIFTTIYT